ncbi:MAG: NUDIX hydrolase [Candidatus Rokuibacteriota bacterium]
MTNPVEAKPAASVLLVRSAAPGAAEPLEVWMIRRQTGMKFLGGYYAFPGGKVDPADAAPETLARCYGLGPEDARLAMDSTEQPPDVPARAYWITAVRELLEESGLLVACDDQGRPVDAGDPAIARAVDEARVALMTGDLPFATLLAQRAWYADLRPFRYLSHFITPTASPIRFSARFFLCAVPPGQRPRLYTEETSEGFWIMPGEGYRRFRAGEMAMAEPAEYGLGYLAQFESPEHLWAAHADHRGKFAGLIHRIDASWKDFDWAPKAERP